MRSLLPLLLCLLLTNLAAAPRELPNPAGPGAMGSALTLLPGGDVMLSWLEPRGPDIWALCFSRLARGTEQWSAPRTVASGRDWFINWADFPSITPLADGELLAVWFEMNPADGPAGRKATGYHARVSLSRDGGETWSASQRLTTESEVTDFAVALGRADGMPALVAWLDARERQAQNVQTLYARLWSKEGPDELVDPAVCDCCQLSLVHTEDSVLMAYRGRSPGEIRDIRLVRWRDGTWGEPTPLHTDGWEIPACPVNGPRLAAHRDRVAAVWYTAAQNQPRVQVKFSQDGGETFGEAVRIDAGRPQGRVDTLLLPDNSALFTWLELTGEAGSRAGGIYLRRVTADGKPGPERLLAASSIARASGFPRIAPLSDGRFLLSYTIDGEVSRVATLLVDRKWINGDS